MKQLLSFLSILLLIFGLTLSANALDFEKVVADKTPCAVLIYADWADDATAIMGKFRGLEAEYGKKYNFVDLNIASPEAKVFNKTYYIYPNLPYILLFRNKGKTIRAVGRDCILDNECVKEKFEIFIDKKANK